MIKQTLIAAALFLVSLPTLAAELWMYSHPECSACQLWKYQVGQARYDASVAGQTLPLTEIIDIQPMLAKSDEIHKAMVKLQELRAKGSSDAPVVNDLILELMSEFEELTPAGWVQSINAETLKSLSGTPTFVIVEKNSDGLWVELVRIVGYNGDPQGWLDVVNTYVRDRLPEQLEKFRQIDE